MGTKKQGNASSKNTFNGSISILEKLNNPLTLIISLITIFGCGYGVGCFQKNFELDTQMIKAKQDCNTLLFEEKEKCLDIKRQMDDQKIQNLAKTIEHLESKLK